MHNRIHALLRSCGLLLLLALMSWAIISGFLGCSNEKQQIAPPVVGPAAGSGPMGGGETQSLKLTASPSETLTTIGDEQATIAVTALVENSIGQPMPDGTAVYWSTTQGTIAPTVGSSSNGAAEATVTFPKSFDGCSTVTARSGDAEGTIKLCVNNAQPTATAVPPTAIPTSVPTATPTPVTRTLEIISPPPPTAKHDCADGNLTVTVLAANGGIPENGTNVTFIIYGDVFELDPATPSTQPTNGAGIASYTFLLKAPCTAGKTTTIVASTTDGRKASIVITTE